MPNLNCKQPNRSLAVLAYLSLAGVGLGFIAALIPGGRRDPFVRFHLGQGVIVSLLKLTLVPINILSSILGAFLGPFSFITSLASMIVSSVGLVFMIIGIVNVCQHKREELPVIGHLARAFKI